jgi:hypothetical protein
MKLPFEGFNRKIGTFMSANISPSGDVLTEESWNKESNKFLPTKDDNLFIESLNDNQFLNLEFMQIG